MASGYYIQQCISRAPSLPFIEARKQKTRSDLGLTSQIHSDRERIQEAETTSAGKQGQRIFCDGVRRQPSIQPLALWMSGTALSGQV